MEMLHEQPASQHAQSASQQDCNMLQQATEWEGTPFPCRSSLSDFVG
jgi:hypothetical protein